MFEKLRNTIANGFNWIANKLHIDKKKLDIGDIKDIYDMVTEFIEGGDDGVINATDALLLLHKLQKLITKNKIEEVLEKITELDA